MKPYEPAPASTATGVTLSRPPLAMSVDQLVAIGFQSMDAGLYEVALASFLMGLQLERRPDVLAYAANAYRLLWRFDEARTLIDEAHGIAPTDGRVVGTMGLILHDIGRSTDAVVAFDRAMSLGMTTPNIQFARAWALFASGQFNRAFKAYEARFLINAAPAHTMPRWKGEPLGGKTLLVESEQGYGDVIMFSRFLYAIEGNHIVAMPPPLMGLFPDCRRLGETIQADYWCPIMSLPLYVASDIELRAPIKPTRRLPLLTDSKLNIGVWWQSKAGLKPSPGEAIHGVQKSCPMELFVTELATLPGVRLHCLQTDVDVTMAQGLIVQPPLVDFADQASYMSQMDLLIGVDTAPLHLAGAMKRPTIGLLNYVGGWPWTDRHSTVWYPSMRLARQQTPGEWLPVLKQARKLAIDMLNIDMSVKRETMT